MATTARDEVLPSTGTEEARRASVRISRWRESQRGLLAAALTLALACGKSGEDDPSAGQTGSPVVEPDHGSRVPPLPPSEPPSGGQSPILPHVPFAEPELTASFGSWLYAATQLGLFAVDTSSEPASVVRLLPETRPVWVAVDGTTLQVIASVLPSDPAEVEQGALTRIFRLDLSNDPAQPTLLGSVDRPGMLLQARLTEGRLVTLTAEYENPTCFPSYGYGSRSFEPARLTLTDLRLDAGAWAIASELSVEAEGFIETEAAFVLVHDGRSNDPGVVTVVEIGADGFSAWPSLNLESEAFPRSAMALSGQRLALLRNTREASELAVFDRGGGPPRVLGLSTPALIGYAYTDIQLHSAGQFALVALGSRDGAPPRRLIVDWLRAEGPVVTAELPPEWIDVLAIGDRFLGWSRESSFIFRVGPEGTLDVEAELGPPPGGLHGFAPRAHAEGQSYLLPYALASESPIDFPGYALAVLDLGSTPPAWRAGPRLQGDPALTAFDGVSFDRYVAHSQGTSSDLFWITRRVRDVFAPWMIEQVDLALPESRVIALGARTVATSLEEDGSFAEIRSDYRGFHSVRLSGERVPGGETNLQLAHGALELQRYGEGWLSFSPHWSNACSPSPVPNAGDCLPEGIPGLSQIAIAPPHLVCDVALPTPNVSLREERQTEWEELVAQGEHVAVLQYRSVWCQSEAECDELGIEPEIVNMPGCVEDVCAPGTPELVPSVRGIRSEQWLHPFDIATSSFSPPVKMGDIEHGRLGLDGMRVEGELALSLVTELERAPDGINLARARIELLRLPSLDAAGVLAGERVTIAGVPMYVGPEGAVTLEPTGLVDANGVLPAMLVHRLSLDGALARFEQTLELPTGYAGHLWADRRGYLLFRASDRCAALPTTLVSVRLVDGQLEESGRIDLPGTRWQLAQVSDELALLTRQVGGIAQHALIDAGPSGLELRSIDARSSLPSVAGSEVRFADGP